MTEKHPKKMFYAHVPSCAGTTFWQCLRKVYGNEKTARSVWRPGDLENFLLRPFPKSYYRALDAFGGHVPAALARQRLPHLHLITIIRDPVDRWVSEHRRRLRNGRVAALSDDIDEDIRARIDMSRTMGGLSFYTAPGPRSAPSVNAFEDFWSQDDTSIGLTEQFDETLVVFAEELNWPTAPDYKKKNIGGNATSKISQDTRDRLLERMELDWALYETGKRIFQERCNRIGLETVQERTRELKERVEEENKGNDQSAVKKQGNKNIKWGTRSIKMKQKVARMLYPSFYG